MSKSINIPEFIDAQKYFDLAGRAGADAAFKSLFADLGLPTDRLQVGPTDDLYQMLWCTKELQAAVIGVNPSNGDGLTTTSSGFGRTEEAAKMNQLIRILNTEDTTHLFVDLRASPNENYVRGQNYYEVKLNKAAHLLGARSAATVTADEKSRLKSTFNDPSFIDAQKYFDLAKKAGADAAFKELFAVLGVPADVLTVKPNNRLGKGQFMASLEGLSPSTSGSISTDLAGFGATEEAAKMAMLIGLMDCTDKSMTHLEIDGSKMPGGRSCEDRSTIRLKRAERVPSVPTGWLPTPDNTHRRAL